MILLHQRTGKRYSGDTLEALIAALDADSVGEEDALAFVTTPVTLVQLREARGRNVAVRGNVHDGGAE